MCSYLRKGILTLSLVAIAAKYKKPVYASAPYDELKKKIHEHNKKDEESKLNIYKKDIEHVFPYIVNNITKENINTIRDIALLFKDNEYLSYDRKIYFRNRLIELLENCDDIKDKLLEENRKDEEKNYIKKLNEIEVYFPFVKGKLTVSDKYILDELQYILFYFYDIDNLSIDRRIKLRLKLYDIAIDKNTSMEQKEIIEQILTEYKLI